MFKVDKSSNVGFYNTLLLLGLTVSLLVKDIREVTLNARKIAKEVSKLWSNNWYSITYNRIKKAIIMFYYIDNNFG